MKILAIDTTAKTAAISITDGESLIATATLNTPGTHSVTVLPTVDALLKGSSLTVGDIDIFACSAGPGSFTGVRIGVALIKGLAFGTDKPCIGVSSLESLARNMSFADGIICPVMDARRNQLYNALFRFENGIPVRLTEDRLLTAAELAVELESCSENIIFVGDGCAIAEQKIIASDASGRMSVAPELYRWQNGYSVAQSAFAEYKSVTEVGGDISKYTAAALSPVYLRASQAERERNERLAKDSKN